MSDTPEDAAWLEQCRYQLDRDVMTRINYGFCHVHKPVLDDEPVRAFATMAEYRRWCDRALPAYLGYRLAVRSIAPMPESKFTPAQTEELAAAFARDGVEYLSSVKVARSSSVTRKSRGT